MVEVNTERAMQILNRLVAQHLGNHQPKWRCWTIPKRGRYPMWRCGWTVERESNGKFASFIYVRTRKGWELKRKVSHSTRRAAKSRACRLYRTRQDLIETVHPVVHQ